MEDKWAALIIGMVLAMSGFNSVVLLVATSGDCSAGAITAEPLVITKENNPGDPRPPQDVAAQKPAREHQAVEMSDITLPRNSSYRLKPLFNTNTYLVVGKTAKCEDVLGSALITHGLAQSGVVQNPDGRTDTLLQTREHERGNLIIVGGPNVNSLATEFGEIFGIDYNYRPGESFEIFVEGKSIYLNINKYPKEDICIIYLGEHNNRNVLLIWGFYWQGTYAGSLFAADSTTWETYSDAHLLLVRWIDSNRDWIVQKSEIRVEACI
jgi:hypothetical protein